MMAHLYKHLRIHQIFGANTDVGKTIITTALVRSSAATERCVYYLKPVSTGPQEEADDMHVKTFTAKFKDRVKATCLFQLRDPVSPHLAAKMSPNPAVPKEVLSSDKAMLDRITKYLRECSVNSTKGHIYIETAGGVHSPCLSGVSQADAYRPIRLPVLLIGDSKLGGISTTISSYESLLLRGYSVDSVLLFRDEYLRNWEYLTSFFNDRGIQVAALSPPPPKARNFEENVKITDEYYDSLTLAGGQLANINRNLDDLSFKRIKELDSMAPRARKALWWPFVQHNLVKSSEDVTVIDSAHGDFFTTYSSKAESPPAESSLHRRYDGSASWWTQAFGHSHPRITSAAAKAAGRYGHVIFPQAVHEPALNLAERILEGPGKGWASRVFFSDNGSTAIEVALKMALRAFTARHPKSFTTAEDKQKLGVLGIKGSYHGDTIGAMDACSAGDGVYTCEWHNSKGFWFDPPTIGISNGEVFITLPRALDGETEVKYRKTKQVSAQSLEWVYDVDRRLGTPLAQLYQQFILGTLAAHRELNMTPIAAVILEPVVMGAGGMVFVDPLFQRVLIDTVRGLDLQESWPPNSPWRGKPIIFDEVFTGLYRLGFQSASSILGVKPDISVYAKTLTGGLVPMALTLASNSIFETFLGNSKAEALLHGHSYTAHPVGCEVANESLKMMEGLSESQTWTKSRAEWKSSPISSDSRSAPLSPKIWSLWDPEFVMDVSSDDEVEQVMAMGTVLAIKFKSDVKGYESTLAHEYFKYLQRPEFGIHYRTLGNVAYFMASLNTDWDTMREVEKGIRGRRK